MAEALVPGQVRHAARFAVPLEVRRRAGDDHPVGPQRARHQTVRVQLSDADGRVEALAEQVGQAVAEVELDAHLRMPGEEIRHQRRDRELPQRDRDRHAQLALRLAAVALDGGLGPADLLEHAAAVLGEGLADFGEPVLSRGALDQQRAQMAFQCLHMPADHRRGQVQRPCRGREAARVGHRDQHLHAAQLVEHDSIAFLWNEETGWDFIESIVMERIEAFPSPRSLSLLVPIPRRSSS